VKVRNINSARALVGAILLGILAFVILVQYAPDSVAFSPNNYGWNGLQGVASTYHVNFTTTLTGLPTDGVLAVLQPAINYSSGDANDVKDYLFAGGTVLVADKSGVANSLLQGVGSGISIESQFSIGDPVYNWRAKTVPTALVLPGAANRAPFASNVSGLALSQPSPLALGNSGAVQVAVSSQFSEVQGGTMGPFTVVASERMGNGVLIVVGDSQFLLNSEWTIASNKVLIGNLFANRSVFIDASHWSSSPLTSSTAQVKAELRQTYAILTAVPMRYAFTAGLVLLGLVLVPSRGRKETVVPDEERSVSIRPFNGKREGS